MEHVHTLPTALDTGSIMHASLFSWNPPLPHNSGHWLYCAVPCLPLCNTPHYPQHCGPLRILCGTWPAFSNNTPYAITLHLTSVTCIAATCPLYGHGMKASSFLDGWVSPAPSAIVPQRHSLENSAHGRVPSVMGNLSQRCRLMWRGTIDGGGAPGGRRGQGCALIGGGCGAGGGCQPWNEGVLLRK